jgi:MSHA biogenesis protein MshN
VKRSSSGVLTALALTLSLSLPALAASGQEASTGDETPRAGGESPRIEKSSHPLSVQQLAENDYRAGAVLFREGRFLEAQAKFELALQRYPDHVGARQGLFGVLLRLNDSPHAAQVLQEGLERNPRQPGFAMALARVQVDAGDVEAAVQTLSKTLPAAAMNPDYLAFLAALFQRQDRHEEAAAQFRSAVALAPDNGVWWVGLAASLDALGQAAQARAAFQRAKATRSLAGEVAAYVDQQLQGSL